MRFNPDGTLKYEKEKSINKIGHALHDLDPIFNRFSRSGKVKELAGDIGLENRCWSNRCTSSSSRTSAAKLHVIRTARFFTPSQSTSLVYGSLSKMQLSRTVVFGPYPADIDTV